MKSRKIRKNEVVQGSIMDLNPEFLKKIIGGDPGDPPPPPPDDNKNPDEG